MLLLWCRASHMLHVAFWFGMYKWIAPVSWLTRCIVKSCAGMWSVHATVTMGKSGKNVRIVRFGQSLPSYLQNNQNHATQQSGLEFSLNNLSKSGSWLLMASFQVICPGFLSQEKRICKKSACLCLTDELGMLQLRYSHTDRPCLKPMGVKHSLRSKT